MEPSIPGSLLAVKESQANSFSSKDSIRKPTTNEEIELVILKLPTKKIPGPDNFPALF
jgi:hypothetical protein